MYDSKPSFSSKTAPFHLMKIEKEINPDFHFLPLFLGFPIDSHIQLKNGSQIEIKNGHTVKAVPL